MTEKQINYLKEGFDKVISLDEKLWRQILVLFSKKKSAKGNIFCREGEPVSIFGFVYSGILRMFNITADGKELTKIFLLPGDFFVGAINFDEYNLVTIDGLTDSVVLSANYQQLEMLTKQNSQLSDFKNKIVAKYVQQKQRRENNHLALDANEKYKIFLKDFPGLIEQIPHYHIASYLGITPTQLSRIRKK